MVSKCSFTGAGASGCWLWDGGQTCLASTSPKVSQLLPLLCSLRENKTEYSSPEVARVIFSKSQIMLCPCSKPADHIHSVDQAPASPHRCPSLLNPPWHLQPGPALGLEKHWLSLDPCKHCSSPPSFGLCSTICSLGSPLQTGSE